MNTTTAYDQLAQHSPTPATDLDHLMPTLGKPTARPVRRRLALVGAVSVVTATVLAAPLFSTLGVTTATAVVSLSAAAGRMPAEFPNGVLHQIVVERQQGLGDKRVLESWTFANGSTWRRDTEYDGSMSYYAFPPLEGRWPSLIPTGVAALPTNPTLLDALVRLQVQGSMSTDEAVFTYYGDALRLGFVPPTVRQAMLTAMGRLPHIAVQNSTTIDGRACLKVTYSEPKRASEGADYYYCFDESTASMIEEGQMVNGTLFFRSTLTTSEYVSAVPDEVTSEAAKSSQGEGKQGPDTTDQPSPAPTSSPSSR